MKTAIRILILTMVLNTVLTACRKQKDTAPEASLLDTCPVSEATSFVPETKENIYPAELFDEELIDETTANTTVLPQDTVPTMPESVPTSTQPQQNSVPSVSTYDHTGNGNFGSEIFD